MLREKLPQNVTYMAAGRSAKCNYMQEIYIPPEESATFDGGKFHPSLNFLFPYLSRNGGLEFLQREGKWDLDDQYL